MFELVTILCLILMNNIFHASQRKKSNGLKFRKQDEETNSLHLSIWVKLDKVKSLIVCYMLECYMLDICRCNHII